MSSSYVGQDLALAFVSKNNWIFHVQYKLVTLLKWYSFHITDWCTVRRLDVIAATTPSTSLHLRRCIVVCSDAPDVWFLRPVQSDVWLIRFLYDGYLSPVQYSDQNFDEVNAIFPAV